MKKIAWNEDWQWRHLDSDEAWKSVTLPHDAALYEERTLESPAGVNSGWLMGADYEYVKKFMLPAEYTGKVLTLEFEGVYKDAEVYLNGTLAGSCNYGYSGFYIPVNEFVKFGEENEIRVIAKNADQPNSRWYSGAGIYRPVTLLVQNPKHILLDGIKITTLRIEEAGEPAIVEVRAAVNGGGSVSVAVEKDGETIVSETQETKEGIATFSLEIPKAKLWSPETPELYNCTVTYGEDEEKVPFGIRTITCNHADGFCLNGKRVVIRGACIHHDNGILGARCYAEAEERKIKLLKEYGYNAVRSAHNPCSKAMLEACDRLGMLMMDEYVDMWYIHKTRYDYATHVLENYEKDISDMIAKDYNHPCVVMYSLGNEVAETGQKKGIEFFKKMRAVCMEKDGTRPVTTGVNIFFNYLYAIGLGQYSDKKAEKQPKKKVGSEFFNNLAGMFGAGFMKTMAKLPGCDRKTRECYAAMDVAGYNYGIKRYKHDLKKYQDRVILGSETFCADAYRFWEIAKTDNALIGDFVWAGMDYLGEVGIGAWEYREYAPKFNQGVGWVSAGSGRLDLIGNPLGEAYYTKVAFELEEGPFLAVVPVSHTDEKHSPSAWKFSNAIPSWSWNGLDGKKAKVEVYSRAPVVELYLNGKRVGKKKFKKNCKFDFKTKYHSGELTAVAKDKKGRELSRNSLASAGEETVLSVLPEKTQAKAGEVCFVRLKYTDAAGAVKPLCRGKIAVTVEGGELLALGHACPFNTDGYLGSETGTYYGEAMAVVKATGGKVTVCATDGKLSGIGEIAVG